MIPVVDAIGFVNRDLANREPPVGVYWYECAQDRRKVARELSEAVSDACVIPLLPQRGFDNANALPVDLVDLLEAERQRIGPMLEAAAQGRRGVALVLISRTRLNDPLIGSPTAMPEWFPYCGGSVITIDILDVATSATGTLRSQQDGIARLQVLLYELEGLMLDRLVRTRTLDHNLSNKFFDLVLKGNQKDKLEEFLTAAAEKHRLTSPNGFRATASPTSKEFLGRIIGRAGEMAPNELPSLGDALFSALDLKGDPTGAIREPIFAVALRSTIKDVEGDKARRCKRNVILALYCSSQLVTAAAHAGDYGEFEVIVMRSAFLDLTKVLTSFKALLS